MKMLRVSMALAGVAATLLAGLASTPARAGGGTFAQFFQSTSNQAFKFTNVSAGSGSFGVFATNPVAVTFEFLKPTSFGPAGTPISATLQFLAITAGSASTSGSLTDQPIGQVSMLFTSTGANPVNLLTVTASGADLFGLSGGNTGAMTSDTKAGDSIVFSSSVLSLASGGNKDFSLAFSSLQPSFLKASDGILQSFKASGTGTFGAPVPEASTMVSFGILVLGGGLLVFARKRTVSSRA